jgi:hypothetical protein
VRLGRNDLEILREPGSVDWRRVHLKSMGGAYIAAVTAFTAVNLHQDVFPPALVWLTPPAVGVAAIVWYERARLLPARS